MAQQNVDPISGNVIGATKQTSWFTTQVDFENSFKFWFALQWQNFYIQAFIIGLAFGIYMAIDLTGAELWMLTIPAAIMGFIGYKGFYQFFIDTKNGTSR